MAYRRKPNYHFRTEYDIGINKVPLGRLIIVENLQGKVRCFLKISDWDLNEESTILDAIINGSLGEIALKIGSEIEINTLVVSETMKVSDGITLNIKGVKNDFK